MSKKDVQVMVEFDEERVLQLIDGLIAMIEFTCSG